MNKVFRSIVDLLENRQHNRILLLDFPHNDRPAAEFLVNEITAVESMSRDFEFTVELLSDDGNVPLKDMQGKLLSVQLVRGDGSLRYFTGYVFSFQRVKFDGSITFYEARLGPWLKYLSLRKDNYLFHDKTLYGQTESIFADYGAYAKWDWRVSGEDPAMTDACQFDETDFNYLSRRWEAAGLLYWYEHDANGHTLVVSDDSTKARPIDGGPRVRFHRHGGAAHEDAIDVWSPVRSTAPASVALASFDFKNAKPTGVSVPTVARQGTVPAIESYEYVGAYGCKSALDGDDLGRLRMEEFEGRSKHVVAEGNNRYLQPGRHLILVDHAAYQPFGRARETADDEYLLLSVRHTARNNYLQSDNPAPEYRNTLTCTRRKIPWKPGRGFNSTTTRILAPQTATVVGPSAPGSIYTDEYGRVRVRFHWDRAEMNEGSLSSAWVRVTTLWAGAEMGAAAIPRVGSEVIIQWLDGNPDRPIITGAVYNAANMPPWELPKQRTLMGLRSRELGPDGAAAANGRSNHLILDDTNASIQAQLKSDHQCSQLSLGKITRIESTSGRKDARGEGWELATNAWGVARAGKGILITTDPRDNASSYTKDMGETVERLTAARSLHETSALMAQKHGAQEEGDHQSRVAIAIKDQNEGIMGTGGGDDAGDSGELSQPQLVLSSPAGIAATTAQSTHIASGRHTAITTGKSLSMAAGDGLFASVKRTFRLFVHMAGMRLIAAAGDIDVKALSDSINLLAKLNITHTANRITITAKEEIQINGAGSYATFNSQGIELGTNGAFRSHANDHSLLGPKNAATPDMPVVHRFQQEAKLKLSI